MRDASDPVEVLATQAVLLQRNGQVINFSGDSVLTVLGLLPDNYFISVRHRNHLGMMTADAVALNSQTPVLIDFTNLSQPVYGGVVAGNVINGKRCLWAGDLNQDNKVIYQGPVNDAFPLLARIIQLPENNQVLVNYIETAYRSEDLNLDGKVIFQGPNNDKAPMLFFTTFSNPGNPYHFNNFVTTSQLP